MCERSEREREESLYARVCVCVLQRASERLSSPYTFVVALLSIKRRNSPNLQAKCVVRTHPQISYLMEETDLRSARFKCKYLLKLERNSKQGVWLRRE